VFIDRGKLTRSETLTGEAASRRRVTIRVPAEHAGRAAAALASAGLAADGDESGQLRLSDAASAEVARAVKTLALADVAVLEVKSSAELEELFREAPPS
jgi:hypothetical protein